MIFTEPTPFREAAEHSAVKVLLPSSLNSAEALEQLDAEIRERARFSSEITNAEILDELGRQVDDFIAGETDLVTARNALRARAKELGYEPEPGKEGTIQDFTSIRRLNIALTTPVQMAQGYGQFMQGQDPVILDLYPAQELYRAQARKVPRNWTARWAAAAKATGTKTAGFIALKNTDIWTALSRFGTPYTPLDYNSGMRERAVARARAMALGLIDRDTRIAPQSRDFNQDLAVTPEIRDARLRAAITEGNPAVHFDANGTLRLKPTRSASNEADDEPTDAEVARAIVDAYDPADPATWDIGDDERELFDEDTLEKLALKRYLEALCNVDADSVQTAGNAAHHSGRQMRCPVGTAKGGRFCRSLAQCGGPSKSRQAALAKPIIAGARKPGEPKHARTASEARRLLVQHDRDAAMAGFDAASHRLVAAESRYYDAVLRGDRKEARRIQREDVKMARAEERQAIQKLNAAESEAARNRAKEIVQVRQEDRPILAIQTGHDAVRARWQPAADELEKYVSGRVWGKGEIPTRPTSDDRSYHRAGISNMNEHADTPSFAHEAMHVLEHERPAVLAKSVAFLQSRTAGEPLKKLADLHPGANYKAHEVTREDKWVEKGGDDYTGKHYDDGAGGVRATEILSTGIERMMRDPARFARTDPDFFDHVFSTLHGI